MRWGFEVAGEVDGVALGCGEDVALGVEELGVGVSPAEVVPEVREVLSAERGEGVEGDPGGEVLGALGGEEDEEGEVAGEAEEGGEGEACGGVCEVEVFEDEEGGSGGGDAGEEGAEGEGEEACLLGVAWREEGAEGEVGGEGVVGVEVARAGVVWGGDEEVLDEDGGLGGGEAEEGEAALEVLGLEVVGAVVGEGHLPEACGLECDVEEGACGSVVELGVCGGVEGGEAQLARLSEEGVRGEGASGAGGADEGAGGAASFEGALEVAFEGVLEVEASGEDEAAGLGVGALEASEVEAAGSLGEDGDGVEEGGGVGGGEDLAWARVSGEEGGLLDGLACGLLSCVEGDGAGAEAEVEAREGEASPGLLAEGEGGACGEGGVRAAVLGGEDEGDGDGGGAEELRAEVLRGVLEEGVDLDDASGLGGGACGCGGGEAWEDGEDEGGALAFARDGAEGEGGAGVGPRGGHGGACAVECFEGGFEGEAEGLDVGEALVGVALEGAEAEPVEVGRDGGVDGGGGGGVLHGALHEGDEDVVSLEGELTGEELEEHEAEGVDVGARVEGVALGLLGGHVLGGADGGAQLGAFALDDGGVLSEGLGDAEVEDLGEVSDACDGFEDDVGGLEVAVDDVAAVGLLEACGDLDEDAEGASQLDGVVLPEELLQGAPGDELHDEEEGAVGLFAEVEDGDDVGVSEPGEDAGLAHEVVGVSIVVGSEAVEDLDGDGPLQVGLHAAVDVAHASRADDLLDADVLADGASDEGIEGPGALAAGAGGGLTPEVRLALAATAGLHGGAIPSQGRGEQARSAHNRRQPCILRRRRRQVKGWMA